MPIHCEMDGVNERSGIVVTQQPTFKMNLGEPLACAGPIQSTECGREARTTELGYHSTKRVTPYSCCPTNRHQPRILFSLLNAELDDDPRRSAGNPSPVSNAIVISDRDEQSMDSGVPAQSRYSPKMRSRGSRSTCEYLLPGETSERLRCRSIGSNGFAMSPSSRTPSGDSLASHDSLSDEQSQRKISYMASANNSDALVEGARNRLMKLTTGEVMWNESGEELHTVSQPGTPPSPPYPEPRRKYSEGSQRLHLRRAKLSEPRFEHPRFDSNPVDLSCKRIRYNNGESSSNSRDSGFGQNISLASSAPGDESDENSILKSVLTGRGRSNTLSACSAGLHGRESVVLAANSRIVQRQRIALAKKNLGPVSSQILDRLHKISNFATSLPEFNELPYSDQMSLLIGAYPRLLLLYMAESNLQFVVAPVHEDGGPSESGEPTANDAPTLQFANFIENFIHKCQSINISTNEYFYMRLITLFHAGVGSLESSDQVNRVSSEARQDLQDLVQHHHQSEKLRYSTLLLTLHTLFGVHGGMLQALFCQHLFQANGGSLEAFVHSKLKTLPE